MSHGEHLDPVRLVNGAHADDLLAAARAFGGHPDATSARAERIGSDGIGMVLDTPRGPASAHVDFSQPIDEADPKGLRVAFADLARRARAALAGDSGE